MPEPASASAKYMNRWPNLSAADIRARYVERQQAADCDDRSKRCDQEHPEPAECRTRSSRAGRRAPDDVDARRRREPELRRIEARIALDARELEFASSARGGRARSCAAIRRRRSRAAIRGSRCRVLARQQAAPGEPLVAAAVADR